MGNVGWDETLVVVWFYIQTVQVCYWTVGLLLLHFSFYSLCASGVSLTHYSHFDFNLSSFKDKNRAYWKVIQSPTWCNPVPNSSAAGCYANTDDPTSVFIKYTSRARSRPSQSMDFLWDWWCWHAAECSLLPEGSTSKICFWRTTPVA